MVLINWSRNRIDLCLEMFQHLTRRTGLMGMENRHRLVVQLSAEQFSKHRSTFRTCCLIGSHLIRSTSIRKKDGNLHSQVASLSPEHLVSKFLTYTQAIDFLKNVDAN